MNDWIKAGEIAANAREYGKKLIKVGSSLLEVTDKIEEKIVSLGGECAFPVQLSRNEIAAHYTALCNDKSIFNEGDLVKLDIGVSVSGAIGDTACSVDLGDNQELVKASEEALQNALGILKNGIMVNKIGRIIQETIQKYGFSPIKNLSGHGLDVYVVHDKPNVPNFDDGSNNELRDCFIAVEPFATNGNGIVVDGKPSEIYRIVNLKPTRSPDARKILRYINETYKGLPFAKRWLYNEFDKFKVTVVLNTLEREGTLMQYKQLVEKGRGMVSQSEHSVYIGDEIKILTKI